MSGILVTGASGLIGRPAVAELTRRGFEVHAVSRHGPDGCDLLDPAARRRMMDKLRPDTLLHLAWETGHGRFWESPANLAWVAATLDLVEAFAEAGGKRVAAAGSCAEYDWLSGDGICRELATPRRPATFYGLCKTAAFELLSAWCARRGVSFAWGRVFLLYGAGEHPDRLVASVIRSVLRGEPAACSPGTQRRDVMDARDVGAAFAALAASAVEGPVNIAGGEPVAVGDIARLIGELLGRPELIRLGALPARPGDPPLLAGDPARLRDEVGFSPRFDLRHGLADAIESWRRPAS